MTLAIGGSTGPASTKRTLWADVRDFGAKADGTTDNSPAFQAAVDSIASQIATLPFGTKTVGVVFIPAATMEYKLAKPVWVDSPFIEIRGEGIGTRISTYYFVNHPLFIFGLRRQAVVRLNGNDVTLTADSNYRPDLFGKLDTTAAPRAGARWGFRSHGDAIIQSQASPFAAGCRSLRGDFTTDNWTETTKLTIEFAVEGPGGGAMPGSMWLFGAGSSSTLEAFPVFIYTTGANAYQVRFSTQSAPFGPLTARTFAFSSGAATGVQRICVQIDLTTAICAAFVNGTQVAIGGGPGTGWNGVRFAENDYYPFLVADSGGNRPALGNANGYDFSLYGLLYSRALRYRNDGAGQPQRRVDLPAATITDQYRYFTLPADDPGTIGYLNFLEDPTTRNRVLSVQGGPTAGAGTVSSAFLIHSYQSLPGGILNNALRDVLLTGGHLYGQNVAIGQVVDLEITGVRSTDAYHAIGALSNGANYTVKLIDCHLDGTDSGYFALDQGLWARDITFVGSGRVTLRLAGCNANVENMFVTFATPNSQCTVKIHSSDYGGNYAFSNVQVDYEGDSYAHSPFYCEAHPYAATTSLRLKDIFLGTIGNVPLITLKDGPSWFPPGYLNVENFQTYTNLYGAVLDSSGLKWSGEIKGLAIGDGPRVTPSMTSSNVVIHDTGFKAPPRKNAWCLGAHVLDVRSPVDGQFAEWRCVKAGLYGTPSPPLWAGMNALQSSAGSLAAYVLNHSYLTANLT